MKKERTKKCVNCLEEKTWGGIPYCEECFDLITKLRKSTNERNK